MSQSQITPIASATPDGNFRVNRRFRWIPDHTVKLIEMVEEDHFLTLVEDVSERGIYLKEFNPQTAPRTIGIRKDARLRDGDAMFSRDDRRGVRPSRRRVKIKTNKDWKPRSDMEHQIMWQIHIACDSQLRNRDFGLHRIGDPEVLDRIEQEIENEIETRRKREERKRRWGFLANADLIT